MLLSHSHARHYQPLIIIGAPRTGTNMLRDVLCRLPGVTTWPCDEINYIWRYRHRNIPHDEFNASHATPNVTRYIRRAFDRMAHQDHGRCLVEKTCANSLRVPFVDAVIPDARYVFLVRDGRDVVASAMKRWTAPLDISYLLKKARYVPTFDLPFYACRYLQNRCIRLFHHEKRLAVWGPRWQDWKETAKNVSLPELCAIQWARCVEAAHRDLSQLDPRRVLTLHYEDFVHKPIIELQRITERFQLPGDDPHLCAAIQGVSVGSVGKAQKSLAPEILAQISPHIARAQELTGYGETSHIKSRAA
ncbi:MAG: sulfotransferase [Planctomycetota bacterium]|nr:sulfotransferase [Planctomycetota bacterium]